MREQETIRAFWDGQCFLPDGNFAIAQCADRLGEGQVVRLDIDPERSGRSHRHQFAFVRTAWENLPEHLVDAPFAKNEESLRKHALIATGFCEVDMTACGTEERAERVAAHARRLAARLSGYTVVKVEGAVFYTFTPQSQSLKAMGGTEFARSKEAILGWMSDLIGVTPEELARMGKKEAA